MASGASTVQFTREIVRVAIAQICADIGFTAIQRSALDTFTDVVIKYIDEIGLSSARLANLVGRTETNASDVQCALEDLGVDLKLLRHFIRSTDDGAFPKALPRFPIARKSVLCEPEALGSTFKNQQASSADSSSSSASISSSLAPKHTAEHIPDFLPAFPAEHTLKDTRSVIEHESDPEVLRAVQLSQRRKTDDSLLKLHASQGLHLTATANYQHAEIMGLQSKAPSASAAAPPSSSTDDRASKRSKTTHA